MRGFGEVGGELFAAVEDEAALVDGFAGRVFGVFVIVVVVGGGGGFGGGTSAGGVCGSGHGGGFIARLGALPGFDLPVHVVFVALPVVFAAEAAGAVGVGAAVGAGVSLFVFAKG